MSKKASELEKMRGNLDRTLLIIVVAFGLLSGSTIFTAPPSAKRAENINTVNIERSIASVNSTRPPEEVGSISVVKLNCDSESKVSDPAPQIRLSGSLCDKNLGEKVRIESSRIENASNEEVATVFPQNRSYTTDIIHLVKGENHLTISHRLSNGKTESRKLTIVH